MVLNGKKVYIFLNFNQPMILSNNIVLLSDSMWQIFEKVFKKNKIHEPYH